MQADFSYAPVQDAAGFQLSVTILADRVTVREDMRDDALESGFRVRLCGSFAEYAEGDLGPLGDLVLVDCARADAAAMAVLSRIDSRVEKAGAQLIVSTTLEALDTVFACVAFGNAQMLVEPSRGERVIALGRVLADVPGAQVREMAADDRMLLLRLTEQVGSLTHRLGNLPGARSGSSDWVEAPVQAWKGADRDGGAHGSVPPLPDAASIRTLISHRQARARFFDDDLFADPAWDILLDLAAAKVERRQVSVTSLCIAAGVPATTALRWIGQMVDAGLLLRLADPADKRRVHIALADHTADAMARYFSAVGVRSEVSLRQVV